MKTEQEINQAHIERVEAASAEHGGKHLIPEEVMAQINDLNQKDWDEFKANATQPTRGVAHHALRVKPAKPKRQSPEDKMRSLVTQWRTIAPTVPINKHVLAGAVGCPPKRAAKFIEDNRSLFVSVDDDETNLLVVTS